MRVYYVTNGKTDCYKPTKKEALQLAEEVSKYDGLRTDVIEITLVKLTPEAMCNILGGWGGHSASETVIRTFDGRH